MAVRASELRLSFSAKKRLNPISSPIPLPLTMGTTGPPGVEFPAEKRLYCICLFAPDSLPCCVWTPPSVFSRCVCALGSPQRHAFHWHTPSCHKNASRLNKERVCSVAFWNSSRAVPPVGPRRPREEVGEWLESNTSCKGLKNCQKERNYQCCTAAGIQAFEGQNQ